MVVPVLVVSGCSAVGKSTVSELLRTALEPSLRMQSDAFCRLFEDPFPDPASPEGSHRYAYIGAAQASAAAQFALGGYTVVLDGMMFPEGVDGMADLCERRSVGVHYAVLRADLGTCLERARRRDPAGPVDVEAITALHARFADLAHREGHAIDASGPPEQVAEAVLTAFRSSRLAVM
ncbi:MAG TPA: AAA family ATPase [Acidimicrobiales bacterium]|nr:AAA family ATPase [Acidimicrobiales bacterium]